MNRIVVLSVFALAVLPALAVQAAETSSVPKVSPVDDPTSARCVTNDTVRGIRQYFWAFTNDQILYLQDKGGDENFQVYGVRKVWRQMQREGHDVARCTVARLMKKMALQGVTRGKRLRTTVSDRATPCPLDHVNRKFRSSRPNVLWVSDFTYVASWTGWFRR